MRPSVFFLLDPLLFFRREPGTPDFLAPVNDLQTDNQGRDGNEYAAYDNVFHLKITLDSIPPRYPTSPR